MNFKLIFPLSKGINLKLHRLVRNIYAQNIFSSNRDDDMWKMHKGIHLFSKEKNPNFFYEYSYFTYRDRFLVSYFQVIGSAPYILWRLFWTHFMFLENRLDSESELRARAPCQDPYWEDWPRIWFDFQVNPNPWNIKSEREKSSWVNLLPVFIEQKHSKNQEQISK